MFLLGDRAGNEVTRWLGLLEGSQYANQNSQLLNAAIRHATKKKFNFAFPAGTYYLGEDTVNSGINGCCVLVPETVGHGFIGKGLGTTGNVGQGFTNSAVQFIYAGPKISLAATTHSLSGADLTITAGYTPKDQDVGATIEIITGTGATAGLYVVTARSGNVLTLDHAPGGSATNLTGYLTYTLWRDDGNGSRYCGIGFKGAALEADVNYGRIGLHFGSNQNGFSCGKAIVEQCSFMNFTIANLLGRDARYSYMPDDDYVGGADNHVDHITWIRPWFQQNRTAIMLRNQQSVCHEVIAPRVMARAGVACEYIYAKKGGEIVSIGGDLSGSDLTCLRLGENGANVGLFAFYGTKYDSESFRPLWLTMDSNFSGEQIVSFRDCRIDESMSTWSATPLWECNGAMTLILDGVFPVREDSIALIAAGGWKPQVDVRGCRFAGLTVAIPTATPYEVLAGSSSAGTCASFWSNRDDTAGFYKYGQYVVGTGWVAPGS